MANRFARLLKSYELATKQPPPPGCILVHNRIDGSTRGFRTSLPGTTLGYLTNIGDGNVVTNLD